MLLNKDVASGQGANRSKSPSIDRRGSACSLRLTGSFLQQLLHHNVNLVDLHYIHTNIH